MPLKPFRNVRLNLERLEERDVPSSTIDGLVFSDIYNTGVQAQGDTGLANVEMTLTGRTDHNVAVDLTTTTDSRGTFKFVVEAGTYTITETAAPGYINGLTSPGSSGGNIGIGAISDIVMADYVTVKTYEFGQLAESAGWTSASANFTSAAIPNGSSIWFSSVFSSGGMGQTPITLHFSEQTISYEVNGSTYFIAVPDAIVTLSPTATSASTTFDSDTNTWLTTIPNSVAGNKFLSGVLFPVPGDLPGNITNVSWQGRMTTDSSKLNVTWQWAAAVYTSFNSDYNAIEVKPTSDAVSSAYADTNYAGTPEALTQYVAPGGTGSSRTNLTGYHTDKLAVTPQLTASLSGYVIDDSSGAGLAGIYVYLEDTQGNIVDTVQTGSDGSYEFIDVAAGVYQVVVTGKHGWEINGEQVGTVNKRTDGTDLGNLTVGDIILATGNAGLNYDFYMSPPG